MATDIESDDINLLEYVHGWHHKILLWILMFPPFAFFTFITEQRDFFTRLVNQ